MEKDWCAGIHDTRSLYQQVKEEGIDFETIDDELSTEKLNKVIMKVMEGREDNNDRVAALEAMQYLRSKNTDGIIPGCTEISFYQAKTCRRLILLTRHNFLLKLL